MLLTCRRTVVSGTPSHHRPGDAVSYPPPPDQPGPEHRYTAPGWPPTPMPPVKRAGSGRIALFVVLGLVGLLCAFIGLGALVGDDEPKTRAESAAAATGATPIAAVPELAETPTPLGYKPKPSDFKLTAKITDKECFGSAGCSVSFRVDVEYSGLPLGESVTWLIIYEINGVEDAPEVGSLEMTGTQALGQEEDVSTTSSKSKIALKVTSVEKG
jgi:hypothetical protein